MILEVKICEILSFIFVNYVTIKKKHECKVLFFLNQISASIIAFIYKFFIAVIKFSESFPKYMKTIFLVSFLNVITRLR